MHTTKHGRTSAGDVYDNNNNNNIIPLEIVARYSRYRVIPIYTYDTAIPSFLYLFVLLFLLVAESEDRLDVCVLNQILCSDLDQTRLH
jgi:hypothetical protein